MPHSQAQIDAIDVEVQVVVKVADEAPIRLATFRGEYGVIADHLARALRILGGEVSHHA